MYVLIVCFLPTVVPLFFSGMPVLREIASRMCFVIPNMVLEAVGQFSDPVEQVS